jgi:hypothetical protein
MSPYLSNYNILGNKSQVCFPNQEIQRPEKILFAFKMLAVRGLLS